MLAAAGVLLTDDEIEERVNRTEVQNLAYYGYGISSFILSLIETAIELTGGRVSGQQLGDLIALARQMITAEIELFPGAAVALESLAASYPLMLITKGDLLHQRSKLDRSGLQEHFRYVEVVSHKTPEVYSAILSRYGVEPSRFLMVGNSLRSDVLPVVDVGGWAVHVPAALTWSHEHADPTDEARQRYFERPGLEGLTEFVAGFGRSRPARGRAAARGKGVEPITGAASRLHAGLRAASAGTLPSDRRTQKALATVSVTWRFRGPRKPRGVRSADRNRPLERHLDRQLHLARIADTLPQEAVEVEQRHRRQRIDVVGVVERVEHLEARDDLRSGRRCEAALQPPVEREVLRCPCGPSCGRGRRRSARAATS